MRGTGVVVLTGGRFFAALRMTEGALGMAGEWGDVEGCSGWQTIALDTVSCHPNARSRHPEPSSCHPERSRRVWVRGVGRCRITGGRFFAALRMTIWALGMTKGALGMAGGSRLRSCHPEPSSCHPERSRRVWVRGVGRCRITDGRFFAALRMTEGGAQDGKGGGAQDDRGGVRNGRWFTITFLSP